jgi:hypothetical protein
VITTRGQRANLYVLNIDGIPAEQWPVQSLSWAEQAEPRARISPRSDRQWQPQDHRQDRLPGFRRPRRPGTPPVSP